MESALYLLWQVDVRNLVKNKLFICRDYHIQPSEIDRMMWFEYEYMIEDIKEIKKQEEKQQEAQDKQYNNMKMPNYSNAMRGMTGNMSSSMPKISLPKF